MMKICNVYKVAARHIVKIWFYFHDFIVLVCGGPCALSLISEYVKKLPKCRDSLIVTVCDQSSKYDMYE